MVMIRNLEGGQNNRHAGNEAIAVDNGQDDDDEKLVLFVTSKSSAAITCGTIVGNGEQNHRPSDSFD